MPLSRESLLADRARMAEGLAKAKSNVAAHEGAIEYIDILISRLEAKEKEDADAANAGSATEPDTENAARE